MSYVYTCINVGDKYSPSYVERLNNMIRRFDPSYNIPIICYTDQPHHYGGAITPIAVQDGDRYEKWWHKMPWLVHPAHQMFERKILFDLDIIIHGDIKFLQHTDISTLTICKSYWKDPLIVADSSNYDTLYNSSVMVWGNGSNIFDAFYANEDLYMLKYKGIDRFLFHEDIQINTFDKKLIYSYRKGAEHGKDVAPYTFRPDYRIALFHQYPKQEDVLSDFIVREYWK